MLVSGEEDELAESVRLPRIDEIVQHAMQRFPTKRRVPRRLSLGVDVHSVFQGWRAQHAELGGKLIRQALDNDGVAAQGHVRPMLLARTNGDYQTGVARQDRRNIRGVQLLEAFWLQRHPGFR